MVEAAVIKQQQSKIGSSSKSEARDIAISTYIPEEHLLAPEKPDKARYDHPYISFLFYGMDGAGDFIPIKQLHEKYNKPRHELPYDPTEEENGEDDA